MQTWFKIYEILSYVGKSKKNEIFRARKWKKDFETIMKKPVFNEDYEKIGFINDIFGPITSPFISIRVTSSNHEINSNVKLYVKIK